MPAKTPSYYFDHWTKVPAELWKWPHFSPEEIASNHFINGTSGPVEKRDILIDVRAMDMLEKLRVKLDSPFIVNSAYRNPEYNKAIHGAEHSQHPLGRAFDISMVNHDPAVFERAAYDVGFRGFGHYPNSNFMHIDVRESAQVVRWKGTGKNNAWFPSDKDTAFTPPPSEIKPATVSNSMLKPEVLIPVATAVGTSGVGAALSGSGPVAYAVGFIVILAGAVAAGVFLRKWLYPKPND